MQQEYPSGFHLPVQRSRKCRSALQVIFGAALLLAGGTSLSPAAGRPAPPDANALVKKMVALYKQAIAVEADFEAHIVQLRGSEYIQTGHIRYKRPTMVELYTTDPLAGTFQAFADGRTISVYSGKENVYTRRNAPYGGLAPTIEAIERVSGEVLGVRSTQLFSPLSFIVAKEMPREAQSYTFEKEETVMGKKVYKVHGKMNVDFMKTILGSNKVIPVQRDIVLWIDARTNQLVRSASTMSWKIPQAALPNQKPRYTVGGLSYIETYNRLSFNTVIEDKTFHFDPPLGAKQLFQERR